MEKIVAAARERTAWNDFVHTHPHFVLMQSWEWGKFKADCGWEVKRLALTQGQKITAGAQILIKKLPLGLGSLAYIPRGPLVDWQDETAVRQILQAIHQTAQDQRAILLKIEPADLYSTALARQLTALGFVPSDFPNQPQCSMIIDLTAEPETLLANMSKRTRHNIHRALRNGLQIQDGNAANFADFYQVLSQTAQRAGFPVRRRSYYEQEFAALGPPELQKIFLIYQEGEIAAMRSPARFGPTAITLHSGFDARFKRLNAGERLMWHSMLWAKAQGCTQYDVWGIPDEVCQARREGTPLPPESPGGLWGVYQFKRGFGGQVSQSAGSYDYVYTPWLYKLLIKVLNMSTLGRLARLTD